MLQKHSTAIANILPKSFKESSASDLVCKVAETSNIAETLHRRTPRRLGRHTTFTICFGLELYVGFHLFVDVV